MRIAVIGAGWYGCHLGVSLMRHHAVDVYEQGKDIFTQASGLNQGRLHMGFHYPRSHTTRQQAFDNYGRFMETYGMFTRPVAENIYAVANNDSLTDFETFLAILRHSDLPFAIVRPNDVGLRNVEGCIRCDERVIDTRQCKQFFTEKLGGCLRLNTPVVSAVPVSDGVLVNGEPYDYCIDCTYNQSVFAVADTFYEACIMLLYEGFSPDLGITIMDGNFSSLYPYGNGTASLHALTAVAHTPVIATDDLQQARAALDGLDNAAAALLQKKFEENISTFYPAFSESARYHGFQKSMKTKVLSKTASRKLYVHAAGRLIHVFCGKIGSIFSAEDAVSRLLDA